MRRCVIEGGEGGERGYHWLREHTYEDRMIHLEHCSTEDMVADVITKALAFDLHSKHAKNITGNGNVE